MAENSPDSEPQVISRRSELERREAAMLKRRAANPTPSGHRRILWVLAGVIALVALAVAVKLTYPVTKTWRARGMAREAIALLDKKDPALFDQIGRKVQTALALDRTEPNVMRAAGRLGLIAGSSQSMTYWQALLGSGHATLDDKLNYLDSAISHRRLDLSGPLLNELTKTQGTNQRLGHLAIRHLQTAGQNDRATLIARGLFARAPRDEDNMFVLSRLLMLSADRTNYNDGIRLMLAVARAGKKFPVEATQILINSRGLETNEAADLIGIVGKRPPGVDTFLQTAELQHMYFPSQRAAAIQQVAQRFRQDNNRTNLLNIARWMILRDPARLAEIITPDKTAIDPLLHLLKADALADATQWDELDRYIARNEGAMDPFGVLVLRGRLYAARRQMRDAEGAFIAAAERAARTPGSLVIAARSAEKSGLPEVAVKVWQRVADSPGGTISATTEILRLCKGRDMAKVEMDALRKLSSGIPGDTKLAAERAEREVLLNDNVSNALAALERQAQIEPTERRWRSNIALGRMRQGDTTGALGFFEQDMPDWNRLMPRERVIYVALLGATQQREVARRYARQLNPSLLNSQEKELVAPWL
jgi:hypothetical protein